MERAICREPLSDLGITIILGTGEFTLKFGDFALGGIGTATFGAILLHALLRRAP